MEQSQNDPYYRGYIAGYRDGIKDGSCGKSASTVESDIVNLPIQAMALSTRAKNCLSQAGCKYIEDVASLNARTIAQIRNLGAKTASEIAHWLDSHGICYSAWSEYL